MKGWGAAVVSLAIIAAPAAAQTANSGQASRLPPAKMIAQDMTPQECADLKSRMPLQLIMDDGTRLTIERPDSDGMVRRAHRTKDNKWVQMTHFDGYLPMFNENGPHYYETMPKLVAAVPDGYQFKTRYWHDPSRPADRSGTLSIFKSRTETVNLFGCKLTRSALLMDWEYGKFKSRVFREYIHELNYTIVLKYDEDNNGKKREGTTRVLSVRPVGSVR